jgi:hypothetical protein
LHDSGCGCFEINIIQSNGETALRTYVNGVPSSPFARIWYFIIHKVFSREAIIIVSLGCHLLVKFDMSVSMTPGATALTRMPLGPRSEAQCFTRTSNAPLVGA